MFQPVTEASPDTAGEILDEFTRAVRLMATRSSLSRTAAATLGTLTRHGPTRLTTLAAHESVSQPAMTGLVTRLENAGLVTREADATDGRAVLVAITAEGTRAYEKRLEEYSDRIAVLLDRLEPADHARLTDALPALRALTVLARDAASPTPPTPDKEHS